MLAGFGPSKERCRHLVVIAGIAVPVLKVRSPAMFVEPLRALSGWTGVIRWEGKTEVLRSGLLLCFAMLNSVPKSLGPS